MNSKDQKQAWLVKCICNIATHLDMQMLVKTCSLKATDHNNKPWIMEMCSKPRRYLFMDLICDSCSDLLIADLLCTEALLLLSFGCLSGPITVDPPGSGLDSLDVCCNVLIPFISGFVCVCVCRREKSRWLPLPWGWASFRRNRVVAVTTDLDTRIGV